MLGFPGQGFAGACDTFKLDSNGAGLKFPRLEGQRPRSPGRDGRQQYSPPGDACLSLARRRKRLTASASFWGDRAALACRNRFRIFGLYLDGK